MDHKSQLSVLVLFGIIVVAFLLLLSRGDVTGSGFVGKVMDTIRKLIGNAGGTREPGGRKHKGEPGTITFDNGPKLVLEQLNSHGDRVIERFIIKDFVMKNPEARYDPNAPEMIPRGYYVSRPDAEYGDIFLKDHGVESYSVSQEHLFIGMEDGIIYAADNNSSNGTFHNKTQQRIGKSIDIENGMILLLGDQPIRFVIPPKRQKKWIDESALQAGEEEQPKPERPKREHKIIHRSRK